MSINFFFDETLKKPTYPGRHPLMLNGYFQTEARPYSKENIKESHNKDY